MNRILLIIIIITSSAVAKIRDAYVGFGWSYNNNMVNIITGVFFEEIGIPLELRSDLNKPDENKITDLKSHESLNWYNIERRYANDALVSGIILKITKKYHLIFNIGLAKKITYLELYRPNTSVGDTEPEYYVEDQRNSKYNTIAGLGAIVRFEIFNLHMAIETPLNIALNASFNFKYMFSD